MHVTMITYSCWRLRTTIIHQVTCIAYAVVIRIFQRVTFMRRCIQQLSRTAETMTKRTDKSTLCKSKDTKWNYIDCNRKELSLDITLACGQAFRWSKNSSNEWIGVFGGRVWRLAQTDDHLLYQVYTKQTVHDSQPKSTDQFKLVNELQVTDGKLKKEMSNQIEDIIDCRDDKSALEDTVSSTLDVAAVLPGDIHSAMLCDYMRLSINLQSLYDDWTKRDVKLRQKIANLTGIRQLRQDPTETLFTFICSSNNNISRISGMVERMCQKYGELIAEVDGKQYFDFPSIEALAGDDVEANLRDLGFGYRAAYISQTARLIMSNHSPLYLNEIRSWPYEQAKSELMKFHGVGAKVADCVCLMALDKLEAVPVDTHVWQFAVRDYKLSKLLSTKSLTDTVYRQIGDYFRNLWGLYAGWAQTVAFTAELKQFQSLTMQVSVEKVVKSCSSSTCKPSLQPVVKQKAKKRKYTNK